MDNHRHARVSICIGIATFVHICEILVPGKKHSLFRILLHVSRSQLLSFSSNLILHNKATPNTRARSQANYSAVFSPISSLYSSLFPSPSHIPYTHPVHTPYTPLFSPSHTPLSHSPLPSFSHSLHSSPFPPLPIPLISSAAPLLPGIPTSTHSHTIPNTS